MILKVSRSWLLFGKSGAGKTTTLLLLGSILGRWSKPGGLQERASGSSNVLQRASGVSDVLSVLGYVVIKWSNEKTSKKEHVRDV